LDESQSFVEAKIMNQRAGRIRSPIASYFFVGVLCMASFSGCTDANFVPASKIASGKVTLSWNNVPGAMSYNIYFDRAAKLTKLSAYRILNVSNPITVTDLVLGKTYYFGIAVVGESGESGLLSVQSYTVTDKDGLINFGTLTPESPKATTPPQAAGPQVGIQPTPSPQAAGNNTPGDLNDQVKKEPVPEGQATVSWDNVPKADSYNIYWSHSPGVTRQNGKKIVNVTNPYTFESLERGKMYYFVVTAVAGSNESRESDELSFKAK
jgi:fibronectin type 3 domain-containing protein